MQDIESKNLADEDWIKLSFYVFCAFCFAIVFHKFSIANEAFTSIRVIENFVHGYGLRFNIDERVQVYNHPLWLLLQIPFVAIFPDHAVLIVHLLSAVLAGCAIFICLRFIQGSYLDKALLFLAPIIFSDLLRENASSGLEIPLACLLTSLFVHEFFKPSASFTRLLLYSVLATLTHSLLYALLLPALLASAWKNWKNISWKKCILAISPLVLWWVFCLFYYGFPFANSYYATLYSGIEPREIFRLGFISFFSVFHIDFFSFSFFSLAAVGGMFYLYLLVFKNKTSEKYTKLILLAIGLLFYSYKVMMNYLIDSPERLLPVAIFLSIIILYMSFYDFRKYLIQALFVLVNAYIISLAIYYVLHNDQNKEQAINSAEEAEESVIASYHWNQKELWRGDRIWLRRAASNDIQRASLDMAFKNVIGLNELKKGPFKTFIDQTGRHDPFLARMPTSKKVLYELGKTQRLTPEHYFSARQIETSVFPKALSEFYRPLRLVTSAPLFASERLEAIMGFQLGWYDAWLKNYLYLELNITDSEYDSLYSTQDSIDNTPQ